MIGRMWSALSQQRLGNSIRISFALLALAVASKSAQPPGDPGSAKQQEWTALDQRWAALISQRSNPDKAKWAALEDALRGFARKYDIHLEEHASRASQDGKKALGDASDFAQCPPHDDIRSYRCNLFPGPKGVCRYVCVPLDSQVRSDKK